MPCASKFYDDAIDTFMTGPLLSNQKIKHCKPFNRANVETIDICTPIPFVYDIIAFITKYDLLIKLYAINFVVVDVEQPSE